MSMARRYFFCIVLMFCFFDASLVLLMPGFEFIGNLIVNTGFSMGTVLSLYASALWSVAGVLLAIAILKGELEKLQTRKLRLYRALMAFVVISGFFLVKAHYQFSVGAVETMVLTPFVALIATTTMAYIYIRIGDVKNDVRRLTALTTAFIVIPAVVLLSDYNAVLATAGSLTIFLLTWCGTYFMLTKGRKYLG